MHYVVLYPQNGDCIVTIVSMTSLHLMYYHPKSANTHGDPHRHLMHGSLGPRESISEQHSIGSAVFAVFNRDQQTHKPRCMQHFMLRIKSPLEASSVDNSAECNVKKNLFVM